jgi:hypothetical protein
MEPWETIQVDYVTYCIKKWETIQVDYVTYFIKKVGNYSGANPTSAVKNMFFSLLPGIILTNRWTKSNFGRLVFGGIIFGP